MSQPDACTIDRLRAVLVAARDALDPAIGTVLHCDRAAFHITRGSLFACVRHLVPLGSHPVSPRARPEITTVATLLKVLDDAHQRMRGLIIAAATKPADRALLVRALTDLNAATTELLRVIGDATTAAAAAQERAAA